MSALYIQGELRTLWLTKTLPPPLTQRPGSWEHDGGEREGGGEGYCGGRQIEREREGERGMWWGRGVGSESTWGRESEVRNAGRRRWRRKWSYETCDAICIYQDVDVSKLNNVIIIDRCCTVAKFGEIFRIQLAHDIICQVNEESQL